MTWKKKCRPGGVSIWFTLYYAWTRLEKVIQVKISKHCEAMQVLPHQHNTGMFGKLSTFQRSIQKTDLIWSHERRLLCSPLAWWLCRRRSLCEQRNQTQNTDGEKIGGGKNEQIDWEALWDELWILWVYLIVKRSIGPFFNRGLFLLISDLNNHAGVNVFPHQLPGFCDVDGDLWNKVKINSQTQFWMSPSPLCCLIFFSIS